MPRDAVIAFEDVWFSYDSASVLEAVTLTLRERELVCVVGPNGGGKTTLLKLALGLLNPMRGRVRVFGRSPRRARTRIGYVPQYSLFDPQFPVTVKDVVLMGRLERHWGGPYRRPDRKAAEAAMKEVGIASLAKRHFSTLSGGERQRALIARALASEPDLLLLDEPTASVDALAETRIVELFQTLNRRMTVVMVSHDLAFVSGVVECVVCVNRKVQVHPAADVTGEVIEDLYGGHVHRVRHGDQCHSEGHDHG